jgi:hypothetical protein
MEESFIKRGSDLLQEIVVQLYFVLHALWLTQRLMSGEEEHTEKRIGEHGLFWRKDFSPVTVRFTTTPVACRCCTIFRDELDCRAFSGYAMSAFFRDCPFSIHVKVVVFVILGVLPEWVFAGMGFCRIGFYRKGDTSSRIKEPDPSPHLRKF